MDNEDTKLNMDSPRTPPLPHNIRHRTPPRAPLMPRILRPQKYATIIPIFTEDTGIVEVKQKNETYKSE